VGTSKREFVSRAGAKLDAALDAFGLDVRGRTCADFGCNVGGFADCLLRRGAVRVYAVDTGYGALAWRLRKDPRVVVMERTNALYCPVPERVDLVTIDVAWTPQELIVPAALRWLAPPGAPDSATVVSLLKPHYEAAKLRGRKPKGPLPRQEADAVCREVCARLARAGCLARAAVRNALRGKGGNFEYFLLLVPSV
jgi:23S rRNA (cytidine1920-2'-O)/16S rRNA (cytidine1409-2'-O)-methyltransferase